tara:strand:+ start:1742 stop:2161 length:420 start_codon:yes stop_codon:yes gene_type:complete
MMQFIKLREDAILPHRATPHAAGCDIAAVEDTCIPANSRKLVSTGIAWFNDGSLDNRNTWAKLEPRSSLACKGIDVGAGVIDNDYKKEIKVLIINNSAEDYHFIRGDRIAQMVIQRYQTAVGETNSAEDRVGGFGSTGK